MRTRKHYLPIAQATAGMVLAEPVLDAYQRSYLPASATLTEEHLQQMAVRHAEYVCIALPDERSDEQIAADNAQAAQRVAELFQHADMDTPAMAALLQQVLAYRSTP
jgi:hypothetical protein